MKRILVFLFTILFVQLEAQVINKIEVEMEDDFRLYLNDGPSKSLHYLERIPEDEVKGILMIVPAAGVLTHQVLPKSSLSDLAVQEGYLILVPSINWGTEDRHVEVDFINLVLEDAKQRHSIASDKVFMGGLSNGGLISLRYVQLINAGIKKGTKLSGVFAIDSPIDNIQMYEYAEREIERNFSEAGKGEAEWIKNNYDSFYGGSPKKFKAAYAVNSAYTHGEKDGGNAKYLMSTPIRLFSDMDLDFLLEKRHRDLYDWNGTALIAMTNVLKVSGHKDIEVSITMGKGVRPDGRKHPHSWSIMDAEELVAWMSKL